MTCDWRAARRASGAARRATATGSRLVRTDGRVILAGGVLSGMEDIEYTYTVGMDEPEVEAVLADHRTGTLALAADGEAYSIPVAYHYEGDAVYFRLGEHPDSEKMHFLDATERACLVVYDHDPETNTSWSVVVRGSVSRSDEDVPGIEERSAYYVPLRVFDEPIEDVDPVLVRLDIDEITGRRTGD